MCSKSTRMNKRILTLSFEALNWDGRMLACDGPNCTCITQEEPTSCKELLACHREGKVRKALVF